MWALIVILFITIVQGRSRLHPKEVWSRYIHIGGRTAELYRYCQGLSENIVRTLRTRTRLRYRARNTIKRNPCRQWTDTYRKCKQAARVDRVLDDDCDEEWLDELPGKLRNQFPDWPGWSSGSPHAMFDETVYSPRGHYAYQPSQSDDDVEMIEIDDEAEPFDVIQVEDDRRPHKVIVV